jgi:hypothetical protein
LRTTNEDICVVFIKEPRRIGNLTIFLDIRHNCSVSKLVFTSHIDRFNPNNGLAPMVGHAVVDVFIGTVFFRHSAGLD